MKFSRIKIQKWQQFNLVDIAFHPRLTVLTGANGSGKTTILSLLASHYNWNVSSIATPSKDKKGVWKWMMGLFHKRNEEEITNNIGSIVYDSGAVAELTVPETANAQYSIKIHGKQPVSCFFIPSHRSVFRYQPIEQVQVPRTSDTKAAFEEVASTVRERYQGGSSQSTSFHMKNILISWNIFGQGNVDMDADEKLLSNFRGFEEVLEKILPTDLGFRKLKVTKNEVVLECDTENFILDASSGGIGAIIEMAWQIYMFGTDKDSEFTVIIDELENHLHPTMQRRLLPDMLNAFPNASFIVSTHSPLIVGSVRDSSVYVLRFQEKKITSTKLDLAHKAKSAAEILDEVLGVSFTMPIWAEQSLTEIVSRYNVRTPIDASALKELRKDLKEIGLEDLMPEAVSDIVSAKNAQNQ